MNGTRGDLPLPPHARVSQPGEVPAALHALGVKARRPVLVCAGGADGMSQDHLAVMSGALACVIPALDEWQAAMVDGGTDSGVMRVTGQLRQTAKARFPLVGVAAEGTVVLPGTRARPDAVTLEPHHTQVILVPGQTWGDEAPWLSRVATAIADGQPSLTLVVNGGEIAYHDISYSLQANRPVLILAGTGRTADAIAAAARDGTGEPRALRIAAAPGTQIVPSSDPRAIRTAIESVLAARLSAVL